MQSGFLEYGMSKVSFLRMGEGKRLLIAFPGFADDSDAYHVLEEKLREEFVIYVINLPWHGATIWVQDEFDPKDIQWMITQVLEKEQATNFEFLGHSFGARVVLRLIPEYINQLDQVHLAAADGLRSVWIYRLNVIPQAVHKWLQKQLFEPKRFFKIIGWLNDRRLMNPHSYKFARHHLETPMRRKRLFGYWRSLQHFRINRPAVIKLINKNKLSVQIYMGKRDKITPYQYAAQFVAKIPSANLFLMDKGHRIVSKELAELMLRQEV